MQNSFTPTNARKNFFGLLKEVATTHKPITIQQKDPALDAVIINKEDFEAIEETLYLAQTGTLRVVQEREKEESVDFETMWNDL
ncbi:MAG: type II toxin-antitoxin system prevent-host-death family antitoxin [Lactobacillaceae bacterium]|jgi:prevent-host-death family protein|nr:type II toxin-antitoxin system prevent-host-death family antitoxin [Lactobacillaceae bacterium]